METNSQKPHIWEVWHARFNYDNLCGYKYRPVIIVDILSDGSLVMMVTSEGNKLKLEHDYFIKNWKEAGLDKPSIARIDRIAEIPVGYFGNAGYIGTLSEEDILAISLLMKDVYSD